jgi:hypothetical protein
LLRHLQKYKPEILRDLLKEKMGVDLAESVVQALQFNTQATQFTGEQPDIEITAPDYMIFIEVKVSSGLRPGQLKGYRAILDRTGIPNTKLILLSLNPCENPECEYAHVCILWKEIAEWLGSKSGTDIHDASTYLIKQFVEFLQGPPPKPPVTPPPPSWGERLRDEFGKLQEMLLKDDEIDNVDRLRDYPILHSLLTMMGEVIDAQSPRIYTNGMFGGDWGSGSIGYDFQDQRYYFYIHLYGKECKLLFMTWNCKIDIKQADGQFGHVVAGPVRWQAGLNIDGRDELPEDQTQIREFVRREFDGRIKEFYQKSYEFAQTIIVPT